MKPFDPKTISAVELLLEPDESILSLTEWKEDYVAWSSLAERNERKTRRLTLALTQERMYLVDFLRIPFMAPRTVKYYWCRHYTRFTNWHFGKTKNGRGVLTGYTFLCEGNDGLPSGFTIYTTPDQAEPFIEVFDANMARVASVSATQDVAAQIASLHGLLKEGLLTEEEFERSKELFLGKPADAQADAARVLRTLKQLNDEGVLSDAEFATKKWEVLSR